MKNLQHDFGNDKNSRGACLGHGEFLWFAEAPNYNEEIKNKIEKTAVDPKNNEEKIVKINTMIENIVIDGGQKDTVLKFVNDNLQKYLNIADTVWKRDGKTDLIEIKIAIGNLNKDLRKELGLENKAKENNETKDSLKNQIKSKEIVADQFEIDKVNPKSRDILDKAIQNIVKNNLDIDWENAAPFKIRKIDEQRYVIQVDTDNQFLDRLVMDNLPDKNTAENIANLLNFAKNSLKENIQSKYEKLFDKENSELKSEQILDDTIKTIKEKNINIDWHESNPFSFNKILSRIEVDQKGSFTDSVIFENIDKEKGEKIMALLNASKGKIRLALGREADNLENKDKPTQQEKKPPQKETQLTSREQLKAQANKRFLGQYRSRIIESGVKFEDADTDEQKVKKIQAKIGTSVDGWAGPKTRQALVNFTDNLRQPQKTTNTVSSKMLDAKDKNLKKKEKDTTPHAKLPELLGFEGYPASIKLVAQLIQLQKQDRGNFLKNLKDLENNNKFNYKDLPESIQKLYEALWNETGGDLSTSRSFSKIHIKEDRYTTTKLQFFDALRNYDVESAKNNFNETIREKNKEFNTFFNKVESGKPWGEDETFVKTQISVMREYFNNNPESRDRVKSQIKEYIKYMQDNKNKNPQLNVTTFVNYTELETEEGHAGISGEIDNKTSEPVANANPKKTEKQDKNKKKEEKKEQKEEDKKDNESGDTTGPTYVADELNTNNQSIMENQKITNGKDVKKNSMKRLDVSSDPKFKEIKYEHIKSAILSENYEKINKVGTEILKGKNFVAIEFKIGKAGLNFAKTEANADLRSFITNNKLSTDKQPLTVNNNGKFYQVMKTA